MKKKQTNLLKSSAIAIVCLVLLFQMDACKKGNPVPVTGGGGGSPITPSTTSNTDLIAYKKTAHEITAGFFRGYGDPTGGGKDVSIMAKLPDSLDIAIAFGFGAPQLTQLKNTVIPVLHAKGTKVILTGNLNIPTDLANDQDKYTKTAQRIIDTLQKYNLDGFDIDIESNPTGQTLTDMTGVYTALSKHLGPLSKTPADSLLTFDTNQDGNNNLFKKVFTMVSYVWLQAYGRGTNGFQSTLDSFTAQGLKSSQFIPGFSFYEERGYPSNYWDDVTYPENGKGRAYDYARWEPKTGKKGGVFGYAIDRDAPLTSMHDNTNLVPNYKVTQDLIKIMNPKAK